VIKTNFTLSIFFRKNLRAVEFCIKNYKLMKNLVLLVFAFMVVMGGGCAFAQASTQVLEIVRSEDGKEQLTLRQRGLAGYKIFTLPSPDRLVIDIPDKHPPLSLQLPKDYAGGMLLAIRSGRFDPETNRYVFEMKQKFSLTRHRYDAREGALRISIEPLGGSKVATSSRPAAPAAQGKPAVATKKKGKAVVVIDPGHGGQDSGAIGPRGTQEKDVVLEYARALQKKLIKSGKYKVVLTREADKFIPLRERVAIARRAGGDIFISLHADSAPNDEARGLSVYTVSEKASDKEAEALAARENKADVIAGMDLSGEREDVAGILISLAQRETKNNSASLADMLVSALNDKVRLLQNTHRFAGFAVLKAPDIPSVLVEIGFLSHPDEEKLLRTRAYREKVVAGLAEGIEEYFRRQEAAQP
jgi:N-acetylmuramoyl-L-alanine amidase